MSASKTGIDRMQPHNLDAEQAVLGACLIDHDAVPRVATIIAGAADFYRTTHGWLYQAILDLNDAGTPPDFVSVCDMLDSRDQLDGAGGAAFVVSLINATPTSVHIEYYARIVRDHARRRQLIEAAGKIVARAYDESDPEPLAFAHKTLLELGTGGGGGLAPVAEAASTLFNQAERWAQDPLYFGQVRGLATGIPTVDQLLEGMQPGDEVFVVGRPSMGKSALAFDIARRAGRKGRRVAVFSLEMPREKVVARWASAESKVESRRVRRGLLPEKFAGTEYAQAYVTSDELAAYVNALASLSEMSSVLIDDSAGVSSTEIRARAMTAAQRLGGLDLVVVDHCGLMRATGRNGENSSQVEGSKSQDLKTLAKELGCVVLLVHQLNRGVEGRNNKRPVLSDLRDSGEHEQNADIVVGLYRDSYYNQAIMFGTERDKELEAIVLKHRDGVSGRKGIVRYERSLNLFTEYSKGDRP